MTKPNDNKISPKYFSILWFLSFLSICLNVLKFVIVIIIWPLCKLKNVHYFSISIFGTKKCIIPYVVHCDDLYNRCSCCHVLWLFFFLIVCRIKISHIIFLVFSVVVFIVGNGAVLYWKRHWICQKGEVI